MNEMIERVADLISERFGEELCRYAGTKPFCARKNSVCSRACYCVGVAITAIEAMREPTEAMQKAGLHALDLHAECNCSQHEVWAAMIDEALK